MHPFNKMFIYFGSEVWIPEFLVSDSIKATAYLRAKGLRGPELPGTVEGAETALEG